MGLCVDCTKEQVLFGPPPPELRSGSELRLQILMLESKVKSLVWAMNIGSEERTALELRVAVLEQRLGDADTALTEAAHTAEAGRDLRLAAADTAVVALRELATGVKP